MNALFSNKLVIFSLVIPAVLLFCFAILMPIILSVYYGMTDYMGMGEANFVGLKNFETILFKDNIFWQSLLHAALLAIGFVFIQHPICMLFAVLLDKVTGKWESFFRAAYFIPNVIAVTVIAAMWVFILNPNYGMINTALRALGLDALALQWLGDPGIALYSVLMVLIWHGFGWGLLIYYAGIKGIDPQLYEAAAIDGANGRQTFFKITLPQMKPVIRVNVTLAVISALKQMETVYLMTNGGPGNSTQFLANYLYIKAFSSYEYGYGNAISVLFVLVCLVATLLLGFVFKDRDRELRLQKRLDRASKKRRLTEAGAVKEAV